MKVSEITAEDYQRTMKRVWDAVRGYCSDDDEAKNTIEMSVENYLYDIQNGSTDWKAINTAIDELYIEKDYIEDFCMGIMALNPEPDYIEDECEL
jgi:hypothetical protein